MNTLLLDTVTWDLVLDVSGNIAVASDPYSMAQDAASSIRTFLGEAYYNTSLGNPYYANTLGHAPPLSLLKTQFQAAALLVPGVVSAQCFITSLQNRLLRGQVQITDSSGSTAAVGF